jgi:hypothetical protein
MAAALPGGTLASSLAGTALVSGEAAGGFDSRQLDRPKAANAK